MDDMAHVYRNLETSEVSEEVPLKEVLRVSPSPGSTIYQKGVAIATASKDGKMWVLTTAGAEMLGVEIPPE